MSNLKKIRKKLGLTQKDVAEAMHTTDVTISRYEKEEQRVTIPILKKFSEIYGCSIAELVGEAAPRSAEDLIEIAEYDVRVSAGDGFYVGEETQKGVFPFSRSYIRDELRLSPKNLVVLEVQGDSMRPTLETADRVLVDMSDTNPAQPGIFVLWDSDRTVVKRVEKIPASNPVMLHLISDNPLHKNYEVLGEEVRIIGRVVWFARRI